MKITHTFVGVPVSDFAAAYKWYLGLFGRAADMFPSDGEAVWRLTPNSSVYVVADAKRAGNGLLTLAVDDLDAYANRLRLEGLTPDEHSAASPRRLMISDDDGNTVKLFADPAPH